MKTVVSRKLSAGERKQLDRWETLKNWSVPDETLCAMTSDALSYDVVLDSIDGYDPAGLWKGKPVTSWPKNVRFRVDASRESRAKTEYADLLTNPSNVLVISDRFRALLELHVDGGIQYLPITLRDRANKSVQRTYWLAHVTEHAPCIDHVRSRVTWNHLDPEQIMAMPHLVLDAKKTPAKASLFCARGLLDVFFVRRDLALAIRAAELAGVMFWPLSMVRK